MSNLIHDRVWERQRESKRVNDKLTTSRLGGLFLAYERAMLAAHMKDVQIETIEWPSKKLLDAAQELWRVADRARAALAYEIIGEAIPEEAAS